MQNFHDAEIVSKNLFKHSCLCFDIIKILSVSVDTFPVPVC